MSGVPCTCLIVLGRLLELAALERFEMSLHVVRVSTDLSDIRPLGLTNFGLSSSTRRIMSVLTLGLCDR